MKLKGLFFVLFVNMLNVFAQKPEVFLAENQHAAPDYSQTKYWAALAFQKDNADIIPKSETWISDSLKKVDAFYIHPTNYKKNSAKTWTADLSNKKLNKDINEKSIRYQATPFNRIARVYAPRYRQAHLDVFYDDCSLRKEALDFAYEDVKKAFEYYLANYNEGRPIILASHSQGTVHARRLMKEFFDNEEMKSKLICAYLVGFGIYPNEYKFLTVCENAEKTNCYVSWSSFKEGYKYPFSQGDLLVGEVSVNPISWNTDTKTVTSKKGIFLSVRANKRYESTVRIKDKMLWVKTKTPVVRSFNVMHVIDYNLFWGNIRKNVEKRTNAYFR
jgi:hypothetical protein